MVQSLSTRSHLKHPTYSDVVFEQSHSPPLARAFMPSTTNIAINTKKKHTNDTTLVTACEIRDILKETVCKCLKKTLKVEKCRLSSALLFHPTLFLWSSRPFENARIFKHFFWIGVIKNQSLVVNICTTCYNI